VADGEAPGWVTDGRVVRRVRPDPASPVDTTRWPATVPAVEQVLCEGLDLAPGLTVLVGENGSGKSTLVEILAEACRLNPQGGSAQAELFQEGSQAIVATHSPIIAAVPGAALLELGDWGLRPARWADLHLVGAWRRFMTDPGSYFRHMQVG
jgi:predicted ATPase